MDCVGLLICVAREIGLDHGYPDDVEYKRVPEPTQMFSVLSKYLRQISWADRRDGDILYMAFWRRAQHIAILDGDRIIHADEELGRVNRTRFDVRWKRHIAGVWRLWEH